MPNTAPVVDSVEWVQWLRSPERSAVVNVFPIAAATQASKGTTLTDFRALQRAGAVAVTDDGKPILEDDIMRAALVLGAELNFPVVQHAEDTRTDRALLHARGRAIFPAWASRDDRRCRGDYRRTRCASRHADSRTRACTWRISRPPMR